MRSRARHRPALGPLSARLGCVPPPATVPLHHRAPLLVFVVAQEALLFHMPRVPGIVNLGGEGPPTGVACASALRPATAEGCTHAAAHAHAAGRGDYGRGSGGGGGGGGGGGAGGPGHGAATDGGGGHHHCGGDDNGRLYRDAATVLACRDLVESRALPPRARVLSELGQAENVDFLVPRRGQTGRLWQCHSWAPAGSSDCVRRLEAALRTREERHGTSDHRKKRWLFSQAPTKLPIFALFAAFDHPGAAG